MRCWLTVVWVGDPKYYTLGPALHIPTPSTLCSIDRQINHALFTCNPRKLIYLNCTKKMYLMTFIGEDRQLFSNRSLLL